MSRKKKKLEVAEPLTLAEAVEKFHAEQLAAYERLADEAGEAAGNRPWTRELVSEALAVNPRDVERANARAKRHGINVTYDRKGFVHIPNRNERRKLLKLEGLRDKSSFVSY